MTYSAKLKLSYHGKWTDTSSYSSSYEDDMLPEEHIEMEIPAEDLSSIQLFKFFSNFLRSIGHSDLGIMKGACATAFNETLDLEQMRKIAKEYDLKLAEDYRDEICKLEAEVRDLKAKLARCKNPDAEQYLDEEIEAMTAENEVNVNTLKNADVVCKDCGSKYGHYAVSCSSTWMGTCNVCGKNTSVTEVRDWNYLKEGIRELSK